MSDTAKDVTIRDANGNDVLISKGDLESIAPSKTSLMPDDVIARLSFEQFIDLLAFLKDRASQESLRGAVLEYSVAVGFKPNLAAVEPIEANPSKTDAKWQKQTVDPDGRLSLRPLLQRGESAAYVLTHIYSPKKQKLTLHVTVDDSWRIAVGRKTFSATDKIETEVAAGWTPILLKVVYSGKEHKLSLQLSGIDIRPAPWPENAK